MTIRELRLSDLPAIYGMEQGFPYVSPGDPLIEASMVVAGESDEPIMAFAAKRILEGYLWVDKSIRPAVSLAALRLLHEAMAVELKKRGYSEMNSFLPPQIEESFGRRLMKSFGWRKNWNSFCRSF